MRIATSFTALLSIRITRHLPTYTQNEYMLVRPDGSVLTKEAVLRDLKLGGLTFKSIELIGEDVRIYGETAIVTGESRTLASRNGEEFSSRVRLIAVYTRHAEMLKLVHFQSTPLPA